MCMQFTMHNFSILFKVVIVCRPHPLQFASILIFILPCHDKFKSIFNKIKWKYILSYSDKFKSIFQQNRGEIYFVKTNKTRIRSFFYSIICGRKYFINKVAEIYCSWIVVIYYTNCKIRTSSIICLFIN